MKIFICHRPGGAFGYITDGWVNALRDKGHVVQRWDGHEATWRTFSPDLYIGCASHKQPIPPRHACKVALHVQPYGPVDIEGLMESGDNIRWVLNQKPQAVFGYGQEEDRILWSYWTTKHQLMWVPMPTAGDRILFKKITEDKDRTYDIVYLGGRWSYKGITIDEYLIPLLSSVSFKLHGWGDWPVSICSGILSEDMACQFLNNGRIGPCISERHTHSYGIDIPERVFKVALCGALAIHDPTITIKKMLPSAIVASNPVQFQEYCRYFSRPEHVAERIEIADKQRNEVLSGHTYHHRMATLFTALGLEDEASKMVT